MAFAHRDSSPGKILKRKEADMLYILAVVLIVLWLLGMISSHTISGFIHILLVVAIIMILVRIITGRKPL